MSGFGPIDVCEIVDVPDDAGFHSFLAGVGTGVRIAAEEYDRGKQKVLKPDAGDFLKWLRANHPEVRVDVEQAPKLVLQSGEVWMPLVFLAQDVALPIYLNLVSTYLYSRFSGLLRGQKHRVHLSVEFVDGETGSVKRLNFEGDHEALRVAIKKLNLNEFLAP